MSTSIEYVQKLFVYINTTEKLIKQFKIGYMINPTLNVNKVFRYQVEKWVKEKFHQSTMKGKKMIKEKRIYALLK